MTVSEQIIQVIDALCEKFGIVVDWTNENVVPYLETLCGKLITYKIATSITHMVIMILISVASIVATKKFYPIFRDGWYRNATVFAIIGIMGVNFSTICVLGTQIMDIIKCAVFPEMYVFEYVSKFIY